MTDFKHYIYFMLSFMMAAFIIRLGFVVYNTCLDATSSMNEDYITSYTLYQEQKYNQFNSTKVSGLELIAALRENTKDGAIHIYVAYGSSSLDMSSTNYMNNTFKYSNLKSKFSAAMQFVATLCYDNTDPTQGVTAHSGSVITGIRFERV